MELTIFKNEKFGSIRAVERNNEPWFVGKDVAEALGYERTDNAIRNHVETDDKLMHQISASGQSRQMYIINESGLYALIFGSKLDTAKEFKHWVTSEVLPSIRKTGGYIHGQNEMSDSELMAKALMVAQRQIDERNKQIEEMTPKALFADAVSSSKSSILIGQLAKLITQNGYKIGQNKLFSWLRENGYLSKRKGMDWNMPTQRYVEQGLFEIKESTHIDGNGNNVTVKTPKVTGKGQIYFVNKFLAQ